MERKSFGSSGRSGGRSGARSSGRSSSGGSGRGRSKSSGSSRSSRPGTGKANSSKPNSSRPQNSRPMNSRPDREERSDKPRSDRPRSDRPARPDREGREGEKPALNRRFSGERKSTSSFKPRNERFGDRSLSNRRKDERRPVNRDFTLDPIIPEEITGEELDKATRGDLLTLSAENAKVVSRHLTCVNLYSETDPELAFEHAQAAARHAGRVAVVRETAGYAAYRVGKYEIAIKDLKAAFRINGDVSIWPVLADCERGLGKPRKALELAGAPEARKLEKEQAIELRIVAAGARRDLGELDAAVVTLQTNDLNTENDSWAIRLRYAYADALDAAGRSDEARKWFKKCAEIDINESTDAAERCE